MATILVKDLLKALEGLPSGAEVRVAWRAPSGVQYVENLKPGVEKRQLADWPLQVWLQLGELEGPQPRKETP